VLSVPAARSPYAVLSIDYGSLGVDGAIEILGSFGVNGALS
jgi:hypothetical protein